MGGGSQRRVTDGLDAGERGVREAPTAPLYSARVGRYLDRAWLDLMDHKFEVMRTISPMSLKPSEYFYRQCLVSADPDETVIAPIIRAVGSEYFVWASDYPHCHAFLPF
jgi:hypothetical protein